MDGEKYIFHAKGSEDDINRTIAEALELFFEDNEEVWNQHAQELGLTLEELGPYSAGIKISATMTLLAIYRGALSIERN